MPAPTKKDTLPCLILSTILLIYLDVGVCYEKESFVYIFNINNIYDRLGFV